RGGSFQPLTHLSASDEFTFSAVVSPSFPEGRLPSKQQLTPAPKKRLEHFRAASRQHSTTNLNLVIHLWMIQHRHDGMNSSSFRIVRPINKALDTSMHDRAGAHGARFNCNKQLAFT